MLKGPPDPHSRAYSRAHSLTSLSNSLTGVAKNKRLSKFLFNSKLSWIGLCLFLMLFSPPTIAQKECREIFKQDSKHRQDFAQNSLVEIEGDIVTRDGVSPGKRAFRYEVRRTLLDYLARFSGDSFDLLKELLGMNGESVVADLGSGEGYFAEQLHQDSRQVFKAHKMSLYSTLTSYLSAYFSPRSGKLLGPSSIDPYVLKESKVSSAQLEEQYEQLIDLQKLLDQPHDKKPKVVAITYEMSRAAPKIAGVQFRKGKIFEKIPDREVPVADLSISNVGVFSYTRNMTVVLAKALRKTKVGGKLIIAGSRAQMLLPGELLIDFEKIENDNAFKVRNESTPNLDRSFLFFERLGSLSKGISVTYDEKGKFYIIEKVSKHIVIPEVVYEDSYGVKETPPTFLYRFTGQYISL